MNDDLDSLLSGQGGAVSETEVNETQALPEETQQQETQQQGTEPDEEQTTDVDGQKMVPHAALHASKEKVKRYTEQVASFEQTLRDRDAAWERRFNQMLEKLGPKQEPQPRPDFFENPDKATQHTVQEFVSPQFQEISKTLMAQAELIAGIKYGDEAVAEAEKAFIREVQAGTLDPAEYQKVVSSPNRYAAAVQWHKRQTAQKEIGDDPAAYRAKLEAEILAKHGLTADGAAAQQQQKPAPVMPSNLAGARNVGTRSGPAWSGPPSLEDIFNRNTA